MKSHFKRILSLFLAVVLMAVLMPCAFAAGETTVSTPAQVLNFGLRGGHGPVSITKATLHQGEQTDEVYLIALGGADFSTKQQNNYTAFICSALSLPTLYLETVKNAALSTIPVGSKVIIAGHSVGGTVAQQFAGDEKMRDSYEILNVLACGSPTVVLFEREGSLHRLADLMDPIAQLSLAGPVNLFYQVSYQNSNLLLEFENPHAKSYYMDSVWADYDCLGIRGGSAYLTCKGSDCVSFSLKL